MANTFDFARHAPIIAVVGLVIIVVVIVVLAIFPFGYSVEENALNGE